MKLVLGKLNDKLLINLAIRAGAFCSHVEAAVAYAEGKDHPFIQACKEKGLHLTFYGLLDEGGAVSPGLLRELLAWGPSRADVNLVKGHFHAKVIWWRGFGAYVGSANLTHKAWFNNIEAGTFFDEAELVSTGVGAELDDFFDHLAANSIPVIDEVVQKLDQLAQDRRALLDHQTKLKAKFGQLFGQGAMRVPKDPALQGREEQGQREGLHARRGGTHLGRRRTRRAGLLADGPVSLRDRLPQERGHQPAVDARGLRARPRADLERNRR
jgi:hypothetical protein